MEEIGALLGGKYRLVRRIGRGGMGEVFEALHEEIRKTVAVKVLLPKYAANESGLNRLAVEARAAAAVGHPSIIDIHDMGLSGSGAPFLVMEYLPGRSLREHLDQEGTVDVAFAAYVVCHVLSGLDAAHRRGIIHRDLKPDNIFLVESGRDIPDVRLLDFGVSKFLNNEYTTAGTTTTGALLGTPCYMSPEQARGERVVDHRTDLYAVAVILYECLTGQVPRIGPLRRPRSSSRLGQVSTDAMTTGEGRGDGGLEAAQPVVVQRDRPILLNEVIAALITQEVLSPQSLGAPIDDSLEDLLLRALQTDPDQRAQSAAELLRPLLPYVDNRWMSQILLPPEVQSPRRDGTRSPPSPADSGQASRSGKGARKRPPRAALLLAGGVVAALTAWFLVVAPFVLPPGLPFPLSPGHPPPAPPALHSSGLDGEIGLVGDTARSAPPASSVSRTSSPLRTAETVLTPARPSRGAQGSKGTGTTEVVSVHIIASPAEAELFVDGAQLPSNPFRGRFPKDGLVHRVRARAVGYQSRQQAVVFDGDRDITIALRRSVRPGRRTSRGQRPESQAGQRKQPNPAASLVGASDPWMGKQRRAPRTRPSSQRRDTDPWIDDGTAQPPRAQPSARQSEE